MAANPRAAAVAALIRQEQDGFSNLVLDAELKRQKLEGRDKGFASAIFYTVLEHRGTLDYILEQFLPKGLAKLDAPVREILRAALAQARYMQVPVSAAVNEAVKLTRTFKKSSASGLVNAVLRKACGYDLDAAVFTDEIQRLMVLGSAGRDVAKFLHKNYPDEALGILTHQADNGLTSLRANPIKASAAQLCALLTEQGAAEVRQGIVPGSVLARFAGSPADNELFRQGYYHVEGQASQLAALCVGAAPGETVLDLCAAPGGKTILLAEQMQGTGELYSCDAAENRVGLIRTAVDRMGFTGVHTLCNDATKPNPALPMADRILTDVPCSGLGILAKKPDLRYKKLEAARQAELLRYYLEAWQGMFAPGSMQGTVQLFGMEYLALGLVVSLFLVLGLSALGPVMIFGSMMLYGLGSGLLMVQLCTAGGWKTVLLALLWTGLPAAAASGCLCFFGACALQVSSRIHAYSFRKHSGGQARPGVQALLGQYLLTMVVLLPLCGAAAGLSYLGSRL